ncbi:thiamine-phosphate kinase [Guyparkeria hydrothermalis]|uniref:thiamine-phosphate kinase n=1 Tax=Guyparkeria hydrothermalis TaxID=923 RepID=UPI0020212878|nr:thiamine-phosphate kinase [Guyparkeria hydrothermalis]MCL7745348.1 thiamine-phosphate kinase [Guyparkeria hydrothermalis]
MAAGPDEFDLIRRHFDWPPVRSEVALGVGDDAALIHPPAGQQLAIGTDMLIAGRHFPEATPPEAVAHKALAVNLSDLAAMGAAPLAFTLSLGLPATDETWLMRFSSGLREAADRWGCDLVGGDTIGAPRTTLSITAFGMVPPETAIRRGGARVGDLIAVTGTIGDAALGLALALGQTESPSTLAETDADYLRDRLDRPEPRLSAGQALRGHATAGLDISDGLLQDLGHMLTASGLSAEIDLDAIPLSGAARRWLEERPADIERLIAGGDDYELVVALPPAIELDPAWGLTVIGRLTDEWSDGEIRERAGRPLPGQRGYNHFRGSQA